MHTGKEAGDRGCFQMRLGAGSEPCVSREAAAESAGEFKRSFACLQLESRRL